MVLMNIEMPETCAECPCMRHDAILSWDSNENVHAYQCNLTLNRIENPDYALSRKEAGCPLVECDKRGEHR